MLATAAEGFCDGLWRWGDWGIASNVYRSESRQPPSHDASVVPESLL